MKYALLAIVVLGVLCWLSVRQFRLVRSDLSAKHNAIGEAWDQVDDDLKDRADLVPRLASLVRKSVASDADAISRAKAAAAKLSGNDSPSDKITAYTDLNTALVPLLSSAHRSPALVRSDAFEAVEFELDSSENRIARSRSLYNDAVQRYNTKLRLFPGNLVAYLSGYRPESAYFKTEVAGSTPETPQQTKAKAHK